MDSEARSAEEQENTLPSPGHMLRQAREQRQLSVQQIAEKLYLKAEQISAIENDVIDDATSLTFAKGYVKLYAKHVGLNESDVVSAFETRHTSPQAPAKLQSFSRKVANQAQDDRWMMVTYAILAVILAGVVIWWYQQDGDTGLFSQITSSSAETAQTEQADIAEGENDVSQAPAAVLPNEVQSIEATSEALEQNQRDTTLPSDVAQLSESTDLNSTLLSGEDNKEASTAAIDGAALDTQLTETESPQVATEQGSSDSIVSSLVLTFADDCWVSIEDATGERVAYGTKKAGRVMPVPGSPPFSVTLGAPQVVSIEFEGEPVDMSQFPTGRTARFSLPLQE